MRNSFLLLFSALLLSCSKSNDPKPDPNSVSGFAISQITIENEDMVNGQRGVKLKPEFRISFEEEVYDQALDAHIQILNDQKSVVSSVVKIMDTKKTVSIEPSQDLDPLSKYEILVKTTLKSSSNKNLTQQYNYTFNTAVDPSDKFERISKEELLTLVQRQTFKYFWDFAHPASGMIRERNTSGETVTSGGTGFGLMAIVIGIHRGFISKTAGLERVSKIVNFLKTADRYHGAYSHWYNGANGRTQPFSDKDNGADLVETALLFQGLIVAAEFFNDPSLTDNIQQLFDEVEWNFFLNDQDALTWHWSPTYQWDINLKIQGWNESLITYVLAAASSTHSIEKNNYESGWAKNGSMKNGKTFYDIQLPLGPDYGGPLFLSQYSFMGINPMGLKDQYADYELQTKNHSLIHQAHAVENPNNYYGYQELCWGFTASDDIEGYSVHSPSQDNGVITPSAALASMPFTPDQSYSALEYFYYTLGDKIWGDYGFKDAFSLHDNWFADSYIAIDQGPIIIGVENHRSNLIWDLFMKSTIAREGLNKLGFTSPNLQ